MTIFVERHLLIKWWICQNYNLKKKEHIEFKHCIGRGILAMNLAYLETAIPMQSKTENPRALLFWLCIVDSTKVNRNWATAADYTSKLNISPLSFLSIYYAANIVENADNRNNHHHDARSNMQIHSNIYSWRDIDSNTSSHYQDFSLPCKPASSECGNTWKAFPNAWFKCMYWEYVFVLLCLCKSKQSPHH